MPIVRIDLIEGKSEEYRAQVGEIVYQTLVLDILRSAKATQNEIATLTSKAWERRNI